MKYFDHISQALEDALINRGVDIDTLRYAVKSDIDGDGMYVDSYVLVSDDTLYYISGAEKTHIVKRKIIVDCFEVFNYKEFLLSEIESSFVQRYISTGHFCIKKDGEIINLCRFSIGYADKFEHFSERVQKLKNSEEIDDTRLEDNDLICPKCKMPYPQKNRGICPNCMDKGSVFSRLIKMFIVYKTQALIILGLIIASALLGVIAPYFGSKVFYDEVLKADGKFYQMVLQIVLVMVIFRVFSVVLHVFYGMIVSRITTRVTHDIRTRLFGSIERLSLNFFTSKQTGSLMSRIDGDADQIYGFFTDIVPYALTNIVTLAGTLVIMFSINIPLACVVLAASVLMGIFTTRFAKKQRKMYHKWHLAYKGVSSVISDSLNGQRVVKAFAREGAEIERFEGRSQYMFDVEYNINVKIATTYPKIRLVFSLAITALWLLGGYLILGGYGLTYGGLMAMITYSSKLNEPIEFFMTMSNRINRCVVAGARVFEILDARPSVVEKEQSVKIDKMKGDISLKNVDFEYEAGRPIIKNVSMDIKSGQLFGIVGKTGAGKSTIINLISRLYDPKSGVITIDGVDLKDISFESLRKNIGVVTQETYLFMGSVADNIRYARPNATYEEVIKAAKAAYAHEFIMKLPDGYDTLVGSGNVSLSGGERQRISIARAIIQNPTILILDEATAAMDTRTEGNIQNALAKMQNGRTIISIAHRLSTLRDADVLAVINKGEVVEFGTHRQLIDKKGEYYELYKVQSEALKFIGVGGEE